MKEAVALLILLHIVMGIGASIGVQRKSQRLMAETRWVPVETPRWPDLPPAENIEDLRNR